MFSTKRSAAMMSISSNVLLIIIKLIVGIVSGSVSIISEAIHSSMDLAAAVIAFISVRLADRPADEDHPFGHDKIENISGVIEAILIFIASILIIIEAVKKLVHPEPVESIELAVGVMLISSLVNTFVSRHLYKVAKREHSIALEADALHLKVDVYTSLGVGAGLFLIWASGKIFGVKLAFLDPVVAIVVALFILREAYEMLLQAFNPLVDAALSVVDIEYIKSFSGVYQGICTDIHNIRTRRSGKVRHIDFHMLLPDDLSVKQAHDLCDCLEQEMEKHFMFTNVVIHVESCGKNCCDCSKMITTE